MKIAATILAIGGLMVFQCRGADRSEICRLKSPDGLNAVVVGLDEEGQPYYRVEREGVQIIENSPLGLRCIDEDYSRQLTLIETGPQELVRQNYQLLAGNRLCIDTCHNQRRVILKNNKGSLAAIELAAGNEGIAFRYSLDDIRPLRTITEEKTGFQIPLSASGWMSPYHAAGLYTPAYEDFYFPISPGQEPPESRQKARGWCLPALFQIPSASAWMLIAEAQTDDSYCACHLEASAASKGLYTIGFAYEDEVTGARRFNQAAHPESVAGRMTPWRVIVIGRQASDILLSSWITDLAAPSRIEDTSWIKTGRASWSWWSHPEEPNTEQLYNQFTDLAADFGWEYTLFDAGWWNVNLAAVCRYAQQRNVKPMLWAHAADFYDADRRRRKMDEWRRLGIVGIKADFWCSDRQEAIQAIFALLEDAAERKMVVVLHGCTIPRGWHRTWPNLLSAEAVLGTECYFFEPRYPEKAAELNTILPFTRNVMAPMDTTPAALTIRKYPRKTTAAHELAAALVAGSGIIHYADSTDVFRNLPDEVKQILQYAPAQWEETLCLRGEPGKLVILARKAGRRWFIAGLNGTQEILSVALDLKRFGKYEECIEVTEGSEPVMQFSIRRITDMAVWEHSMPPQGGFVLELLSGEAKK